MNKLFLINILLFFSVGVYSAENIIVVPFNGDNLDLSNSSIRSIGFDDNDNVRFVGKNGELTAIKSANDVRYISFIEMSDVNDVSADKPYVLYPNPTDAIATLFNIKCGDVIEVLTQTGVQLLHLVSESDVQRLDVRQLPEGVYVVRVNSTIGIRLIKK